MSKTSWVLALAALAAALSMGWARLSSPEPSPLPTLKVEVLNGCGEDQLASRAAAALRRLGQDVVSVGDAATSDVERTLLVDRRGKPTLTRRLAREIGPVLVVLEQTEEATADVTLILGQDHAGLAILSDSAP